VDFVGLCCVFILQSMVQKTHKLTDHLSTLH